MSKPAIVAGAVALVLIAGCQAKSQPNTSVTSEEAQAQALIQRCAASHLLVTKTGRQAFIACVSPPGQSVKVEACAQSFLAKDGVLTKAQRTKFYADLATCIVPPSASPTPSKKVTKK